MHMIFTHRPLRYVSCNNRQGCWLDVRYVSAILDSKPRRPKASIRLTIRLKDLLRRTPCFSQCDGSTNCDGKVGGVDDDLGILIGHWTS